MTVTANMVITNGKSTEKAKVTMESTMNISGSQENDTSKLQMSGSVNTKGPGLNTAYTVTYADGVAHYNYTKPTVTSTDLPINPDYFEFGSLTEDMILPSSISGNTVKLTVDGSKMASVGLAAIGQMGAVENLEYGNTSFGDLMSKYFHGENRSGPYFEGWYFKCQAQDGHSLALIPAIHILENGQRSASIQVITEDQAWWLEYPASAFAASNISLDIKIGGNRFSEEGLLLDVEQKGLSLHGKVSFGSFRGLRSDIMGPFRWLADMECAHSVISMRHMLQGQLELNGHVLDLNGGTGYIEADRGRSFPSSYLWTQCVWNDCSLMLSIATIPLGKLHFTGCICAIHLNGQEHRIATYRGVKIQSWSSKGAILRQGKYRLEVQLLDQKAQPLRAPADGDMSRTIHESLCAKVRYRLWHGKKRLFDRIGDHAGFEYAKISEAENGN